MASWTCRCRDRTSFGYLLHHHPESPQEPLRWKFAAFPWRMNPKQFTAWKRGRTGYPFVDAGMCELWRTGWMHNRVRMVVASFLVKHLRIRWHIGRITSAGDARQMQLGYAISSRLPK